MLDFAGRFRCMTDHEQTSRVEIQGKRMPHEPLIFGSLTQPVRLELVDIAASKREMFIANHSFEASWCPERWLPSCFDILWSPLSWTYLRRLSTCVAYCSTACIDDCVLHVGVSIAAGPIRVLPTRCRPHRGGCGWDVTRWHRGYMVDSWIQVISEQ